MKCGFFLFMDGICFIAFVGFLMFPLHLFTVDGDGDSDGNSYMP